MGKRLFDRDDAVQIFVHRLIDRAHPPMAEFADDSIAFAKDGIRGKHLRVSKTGQVPR